MNFKQRTSNQINPQLGTSNKEKKTTKQKEREGFNNKEKKSIFESLG